METKNSDYSDMSPMRQKGEMKLDNNDEDTLINPLINNIQVTHKSSVMESE